MAGPVRFYLNDQETVATEPPETLVLDFIRNAGGLTGTKEGCREGDCGACVVLLGDLYGDRVVYRSVTSCLVPIGQLQGRHLVTIEGLNLEDTSVVQRAILDEGALQCGFCTPGIVVSLTGYLMEEDGSVSKDGVKAALGGHLCRCTGYRSLKACTEHVADSGRVGAGIDGLIEAGLLPPYFAEMPARLKALSRHVHSNGREPAELYIAGGTDVFVQAGDGLLADHVTILDGGSDMEGIVVSNDAIEVGALTTFEEFASHPAISEMIPDIKSYMFLIASLQIRNRATLGGNIANASPVGDMTILLLALGAELILSDGTGSRSVPLDRFYLGYKTLDKSPGELITRIRIPRPTEGTRIGWEKVSKRKCLDIASVNSAIRIRTDGDRIEEAALCVGGVAPIPMLLRSTGDFLIGSPLSAETILGAAAEAQREVSPITDVRGSAVYKRLLMRQLVFAHFLKLYPEAIDVEELYESA